LLKTEIEENNNGCTNLSSMDSHHQKRTGPPGKP
jgi:hypothetical protein